MRFRLPAHGLTSNALIFLVSLFLAAFDNLAFFGNLLKTYPITTGNALALASLAAMLVATNFLLLALVCFKHTAKPLLILILLLSSLAAYFMDSYGIVIDDGMLQNVAQTNKAEAVDLLNFKLLTYFVVLGILPAIAVARASIHWQDIRGEMVARTKLLLILVSLMVGIVLIFGGFYASFAREHKPLRSFANPAYFIYSAIKYFNSTSFTKGRQPVAPIGTDAYIPSSDTGRELVIMVVGEAARADHFSLNGYARDTNPRLQRAGAISFSNFWSCGTSTAVSVPCIFSLIGMEKFDVKTAATQENMLDVLQHAGVNVLWLDNNSDSKGVALRAPYQSYSSPDVNPVCDTECRDEGMLAPLQKYIDEHPKGDIFIVLHQMGNHGPAYSKRYPQAFEKFKPACQNNDLSQCNREEIVNAYDNAILYTDYFLGMAIELLKKNDAKFETALLYLSDHGESLGENGVYLHGMPRLIAPEAQLHVPAVMWLGSGVDDVDRNALMQKRNTPFTHDNLFHTALGFLEIETSIYRPEMDILGSCRKPEPQ